MVLFEAICTWIKIQIACFFSSTSKLRSKFFHYRSRSSFHQQRKTLQSFIDRRSKCWKDFFRPKICQWQLQTRLQRNCGRGFCSQSSKSFRRYISQTSALGCGRYVSRFDSKKVWAITSFRCHFYSILWYL